MHPDAAFRQSFLGQPVEHVVHEIAAEAWQILHRLGPAHVGHDDASATELAGHESDASQAIEMFNRGILGIDVLIPVHDDLGVVIRDKNGAATGDDGLCAHGHAGDDGVLGDDGRGTRHIVLDWRVVKGNLFGK